MIRTASMVRRPAIPPADERAAGEVTGAAHRLFDALRLFLHGVRPLTPASKFPWSDLRGLMERIIHALDRSSDLLWAAHSGVAPPGVDDLVAHQARTAVITVRIGQHLGYRDLALLELGLAACLFDVGLWPAADGRPPAATAGSLDADGLARDHPRRSAELLAAWGAPDAGIVTAVLQHHERETGGGYPAALAGEAIHPHARIIGLVDTYLRLTMSGPDRPALEPWQAVREILRLRHDGFRPELIKAFLAALSVFPPGTLVRLNSGEVGRVIDVNPHQTLRPAVHLITDARGQSLPAPRVVNLATTPSLFVLAPVAGPAASPPGVGSS